MTVRDAASNVLAAEHADVLREGVAVMVREIMETEVAQIAGAELGELASDSRGRSETGIASGGGTRGSVIELQIPRLRTSSYLPSFLEPRRRADQRLSRLCRRRT